MTTATIATQEKWLSIADKAKLLRSDLKKFGWNSKQISVTGKYVAYDSVLKIRIKDLNISKVAVEKIANQFSSIDYCETSGEVLEGGNTYVNIDFDWESLKLKAADYLDFCKDIYSKHFNKNDWSTSGVTIFENDLYKIIFWNRDQFSHTPSITLSKIHTYSANGETWKSGTQVTGYCANSPEQMANGMAFFFCQYINQ